jgi:hypothetical protein
MKFRLFSAQIEPHAVIAHTADIPVTESNTL